MRYPWSFEYSNQRDSILLVVDPQLRHSLRYLYLHIARYIRVELLWRSRGSLEIRVKWLPGTCCWCVSVIFKKQKNIMRMSIEFCKVFQSTVRECHIEDSIYLIHLKILFLYTCMQNPRLRTVYRQRKWPFLAQCAK